MSDFNKRAEAGILESIGKVSELIDMMSKNVSEQPAKAAPDNGTPEEQWRKSEYALSFVVQTEVLANVLRMNHMPQGTINICLAARCGVPMQEIDLKSPYFAWVEDEPVVQQ